MEISGQFKLSLQLVARMELWVVSFVQVCDVEKRAVYLLAMETAGLAE